MEESWKRNFLRGRVHKHWQNQSGILMGEKKTADRKRVAREDTNGERVQSGTEKGTNGAQAEGSR